MKVLKFFVSYCHFLNRGLLGTFPLFTLVINCVNAAEPCLGANGEEDEVAAILGSHEFKSCTFRVERGDYSGILKNVVENLEMAKVKILLLVFTLN